MTAHVFFRWLMFSCFSRYSMFTGTINSTELRCHGGSSSQAGRGSSRSRRLSMQEAMGEQQERFREGLRQ
jgi:hypothetical protein